MASKVVPLTSLYQELQGVVHEAQPLLPASCLGKHVLGEYFECSALPTDAKTLQKQLEQAARLVGATVVQSVFHAFNPQGLSGVVVIAESHLAVHTWPEYKCASVDLYTCSNEIDPRPGFDFLKRCFGARRYDVLELPRGGSLSPAEPASSRD